MKTKYFTKINLTRHILYFCTVHIKLVGPYGSFKINYFIAGSVLCFN